MADYEMIRCPEHGIDIPGVTQSYAEEHGLQYGCPNCRERLLNGRDVATMTPQERVEEMRRILGPCFGGFDAVWKRVDQLVGRGTYTHELAYPEYLEHEIMTGSVPTTEGIIAKLPHDKPVLVVSASDDNESPGGQT